MEQLYKGRAIIQDDSTHMQITIPARGSWFIIILLVPCLCGWLVSELYLLGIVFGSGGTPMGIFVIAGLVPWTIGGLLAIRTLLWNLQGKEIITLGQQILRVERKGAPFFEIKEYYVNEVKAIRVQEMSVYNRAFGVGGTFNFDYGSKTMKFGLGLDEAEARFILQQIQNRLC